MKNQYFADQRDLFKYDLLVELMQAMPSLSRLVLVPMLTPNDGGTHGGKVTYGVGGFRPDVHDFLQERLAAGERDITKLRLLFADRPFEYVPYSETTVFGRDRDAYFAGIPDDKLQKALVFFDPDTGLEPPNNFDRAHLRYSELAAVLRRAGPESIGVVIQFLPRRDRAVFFDEADLVVRRLLPGACLVGLENGVVAFLIVARNAHMLNLVSWMPRYVETRELRTLPRLAATVEPFQLDRPHFGYGSNMCDTWLERDAPSAQANGSGFLDQHAVTFDKESFLDHSAKATLVPRPDARARGALFDIEPIDLPRLNTKEGGYRAIEVPVTRADGTQVDAWTLVARSAGTKLKPWEWYVRLIVAGARYHELPENYVREIEAMPNQGEGDAADVQRANQYVEALLARKKAAAPGGR